MIHSGLSKHSGIKTEDDYRSYKTMAASVISTAISDLTDKDKRVRLDARRFLFSQDRRSKAVRGLWLAWMGLDDASLDKLLRRATFQGLPNKLSGVMQMIDMATKDYLGGLPALEHDDSDEKVLAGALA